MSIGAFVSRVLAVHHQDTAIAFFEREVDGLRRKHPEVANPEHVIRANIGWCFGEGMPLQDRGMWAEVCGAEHPAGPEFTWRDFTPQELLDAGAKLWESVRRPTSWSIVLEDD